MASQRDISAKIGEMRAEGYRGDVAAAAAYSMARRGKLGRGGKYKRTHRRKRGPVGRMRATRRSR